MLRKRDNNPVKYMRHEKMEKEEIEEILGKELDGTCWSFKYWEREDSFEFRNTGAEISEDEKEEMIDDFLDGIEESSDRTLLSGKLCIGKEDGKFFKKVIDGNGEVSDEGQEITEEETRELLKRSLIRIDNELLPTNRAELDRDEIIDIYSENVRELKMITINLKGNKMITLTDKGGLQFETR